MASLSWQQPLSYFMILIIPRRPKPFVVRSLTIPLGNQTAHTPLTLSLLLLLFLPCHFVSLFCHFQMGIIHRARSAQVKLRSPDHPLASFGIDRSWSGTEHFKSQPFNIKPDVGEGGQGEEEGTFPVQSACLTDSWVSARVHRRVHSRHVSLMRE